MPSFTQARPGFLNSQSTAQKSSNGCRPGEKRILASWYGKENHRGPTASGQVYNMYAYTAAHRTLPMGTVLLVRNPATQRQVQVTISDRGPYIRGRNLDLSYAAARDLGMLNLGVVPVCVKEVGHDARYDRYWKGGVCPPLLASNTSASHSGNNSNSLSLSMMGLAPSARSR